MPKSCTKDLYYVSTYSYMKMKNVGRTGVSFGADLAFGQHIHYNSDLGYGLARDFSVLSQLYCTV